MEWCLPSCSRTRTTTVGISLESGTRERSRRPGETNTTTCGYSYCLQEIPYRLGAALRAETGWHGATEEGKNEACGRVVVVVVWGKAPLPARLSPSRLQAQGKEEEAVGGGVVLVRVFCDGSCLCGVLKKVAHQHQRTRARKPLVLF